MNIMNNRRFGIFLVIAAFLMITGYFAKENLIEKEEKISEDEVHVQESRQGIAADDEDIKESEAAAYMDLKITMPQEMKERIPDYEGLERALQSWLISEDYWQDTTTAVSDYVITEDFNQNLIRLGFRLNDEPRTHVIAVIYKGSGSYEFNVY